MMSKTKKLWLWGAVVVAVAAVGIWASWPEYGKGYSEDQRRNWNEMVGSSHDGSWDWNSMSSFGKRRAQGDAPKWEIDFSKPVDKLSLEGMTMPGLERLANQGNGDACLELAFRAKSAAFIFDIYPMEKNVRKAVKSGRAGSDYLLRLVEHRKTMGEGIQGSDVAGYADFVSLLGKGDFMLGKVYACLVKGDDHAMDRLEVALKERAGQGDVAALRNAGYLGMLRKSVPMRYEWWGIESLELMMGEDMYYSPAEKIMGIIGKGLEFLPDSLKPGKKKLREMEKWLEGKMIAHYWAKIQRSLKPSFSMLAEAAEQGDMHAKFLWTQYVVFAQLPLTRDEWGRHLRYTDELIAAGGMYRGGHPQSFDWNLFPLERCFYEHASMDNVLQAIEEEKDKEYSVFKKRPDVPKNMHRMDMDALCDMNQFAQSLVSDVDVFSEHQQSKEEQQHGYQLLEEAVNEGNPKAMFWLARLLNAGLIVEQDVERSWTLLEKAKVWCDGVMNKNDLGHVSLIVGVRSSASTDLYNAIECQMIDIVSRYGDMPGMSEVEAVKRLASSFLYDELRNPSKEQFEKRGVKVPEKRR